MRKLDINTVEMAIISLDKLVLKFVWTSKGPRELVSKRARPGEVRWGDSRKCEAYTS